MILHITYAQYGYTVLIRAAENGHADCLRMLLDAGADTEAKDEVRSYFLVRECMQSVRMCAYF
jgi:hypothetical protein